MKLLLIVIIILCTSNVLGQKIIRQTIGCIGSSQKESISGVIIQQSIGQSYCNYKYFSNQGEFRPGFIQPLVHFPKSKNNEIIRNFFVYPNPANEIIHFSIENEIEIVELKVFDSQGKQIYFKTNLSKEEKMLNCSSWNSGVYQLILVDNVGLIYQSVIVKN